MITNPIYRVFLRESRRLIRYPRYLVILTIGAVFSFIFFATMTNEGQPQRLPVGVVDMDGSYLSRRICHELDATPGVKVKEVFGNHEAARRAMQRGEIYAFYEIPKGTYNEVLQFHAPKFVLYNNACYLLAGTLCYKQLATMGMLAAGGVQREVLRKKGHGEDDIMGLIQPVAFETRNISNPWINYGVYLMTTLIPAIMAFIVLMHTAFSIVRERQRRTVKHWMKKANGSALYALLGKMLPYTLWYTMLTLTANLAMFGFMDFPMNGSWLLLHQRPIAGHECVYDLQRHVVLAERILLPHRRHAGILQEFLVALPHTALLPELHRHSHQRKQPAPVLAAFLCADSLWTVADNWSHGAERTGEQKHCRGQAEQV